MTCRSPHHSGSAVSASQKKCRKRKQAMPADMAVDAFIADVYLPQCDHRKRSGYVDEYNARLHISPSLGKRAFSDITPHDVETWFHGLADKGLAPATCNRILAVFKTVCALAGRKGLIQLGRSPCEGVKPFKILTRKENHLSGEQAKTLKKVLEKILETAPVQAAVVILLLLLTGARKREILNARWENVHLDMNLLIVPLSKSNKARHIALSSEAVELFRTVPRQGDSPWVFPGLKPNKPLSDVFQFWKKLRKGLGFDHVRIHDLRHTYASLLVNRGHSLYEVQRLLGHSDPRTTMRYAHLGQSSLVAAAQSVSAYLSDSSKEKSGKNPKPSPCKVPTSRIQADTSIQQESEHSLKVKDSRFGLKEKVNQSTHGGDFGGTGLDMDFSDIRSPLSNRRIVGERLIF